MNGMQLEMFETTNHSKYLVSAGKLIRQCVLGCRHSHCVIITIEQTT